MLNDQDDRERNKQTKCGSDLNEAGIKTAPFVGHMLGHIDCRPAILAPECQPLKNSDKQKNNRSRDPDGRVRRQKTDQGGGSAHDKQRHQKSIFASDQITYAAKEEGAERTNHEPHCKRGEISDQRERVVALWIEERRDDGRETAENVEVIPLDHRANRRCADHLPDFVLFSHWVSFVVCPISTRLRAALPPGVRKSFDFPAG